MKKYSLLYKELKNQILTGEYASGEKLPSKRVMADKTGYSLITVERVYGMLEDEGYIYAKERAGYFVAKIDAALHYNTQNENAKLQYLTEETIRPEQDFEYALWFKTVRKVISDNGDRLFVKSPNKGCAILRNAIADYLRRYRGMIAQPRQIIIGSGAEQLYEAVAKILGKDTVVGIENPSYSQIEAAYRGTGAKICKLDLGDDGIVTDALFQGQYNLLHVTPFSSYPSGITASISKRYEYLQWADRTGNYIVEDDYASEFFVPGHPIESLYALDQCDKVIYINTFSKSLSPAMRMGYMILPEHLLAKYDEVLGNSSCTVPVMEQYVLAEFISEGHFERHLNRVRRRMKAR